MIDVAPSRPYALVIHGGAGGPATDSTGSGEEIHAGLRRAFEAGEAILAPGGSALDAVCAAVRELEDDPVFNAGRGAVMTADATAEMDASVMTGDGRAGAVTGSTMARHPIDLARAIMERSDHVFLTAPGRDLLDRWGLEVAEPDWFITDARLAQLARIKAERAETPDHGTVGAVALDAHGHVAAATSTGGTPHKAAGRIGDTPVIGAGTYARDGVVAVSCTGRGEAFIEGVVAHDVFARMGYGGVDLATAAQATLAAEIVTRAALGAFIAVDGTGRVVIVQHSATMLTAWREGDRIVTRI